MAEASIFDDPLMTPPTTDARTGDWEHDGPIRGWELRPDHLASTLLDVILEREWTAHDRRCLLLRVTEYYERGRHTRETPAYGEGETYYVGYVHAPDVESFPAGYCGTYIVDCYPEDGWYAWDERSWSNRPGYSETMRESAVRKTETLARGLTERARGQA